MSAYNVLMFTQLQSLVTAATLSRITLALNHVLSSESVATERLKPHAGRSIQLQLTGWPSLLPALPSLVFRVTPAGLLEWVEGEPPAVVDLQLTVDASNPAKLFVQGLVGERPQVDVVGNAQLAADVSWLMDNLRWDVQDDLARVVGAGPAHQIARFGNLLAGGLREGLRTLNSWAERARR
jgi:ubiquinone biosynthesis protein UbiJ